MALERFIPKSPDPFIRNSQDFEVAKFGHLNTIIEYVNSYVVTDSLQLAGSGPITSTARYITDSLGNASAISISTIGVGIGTDAPTSLLDVVRYTTGSVNNNYQFRILNSADGLYPYSVLLLEHNNRTGVGNQGGAAIVIKDGFANASRAEIVFDYSNSGSFTAAGGNLYLSNLGQGNLLLATNGVNAVRVFKDQGVQIGGVSTNLSSIARLLVKGSGSTSATTSLLVQNSAGTQLLKVTDDNVLTTGNINIGTGGGESIRDYAGLQAFSFFYNNTQVRNALSFGGGYLSGIIPLAGLTASFPAIKRNGTAIDLRLADDSNYASFNTGATFIKGSGSTSATTSLLVQNSSGSNIFRVVDDGHSFMSTGIIWQELKFYPEFSRIIGGYGGSITFSNTSNDTTISDNRMTLTSVAYGDAITVGVSGIYAVVASNAFSINSTTQGFLPPRMTTVQKNAIATPAAGLVVFDTTLNKLCVYTTAWQTITSV